MLIGVVPAALSMVVALVMHRYSEEQTRQTGYAHAQLHGGH